ncbi:ion transporter [Marinimicrococcus flavescens]|uniref:Ion transporter n=1 Tax=Marinimicrococcus flavescens TaxID=3031815 RepID=A0AAP3XR71_9PROT|nr:ion transporter [Marinimicrococcus flavescens]
MATALAAPGGLRARLRRLVEARPFERAVVAVIVLNALVLGLETSEAAMAAAGPLLIALDQAALLFFVAELAIRIIAAGPRFFLGGWNLFDTAIVGVSLVPAGQGLQVLRSLRILRALRLVSLVPEMRRVVQALLAAIPGMGSVMVLLALVFYVAAVMATQLFGAAFPDWFGTLWRSLYTLFQVMTLESWSMGIVRPVMDAYPFAWLYFLPFILLTTFAVLNLVVAIIVNAMQKVHEDDAAAAQHADQAEILGELRALRREVEALRRGGAD